MENRCKHINEGLLPWLKLFLLFLKICIDFISDVKYVYHIFSHLKLSVSCSGACCSYHTTIFYTELCGLYLLFTALKYWSQNSSVPDQGHTLWLEPWKISPSPNSYILCEPSDNETQHSCDSLFGVGLNPGQQGLLVSGFQNLMHLRFCHPDSHKNSQKTRLIPESSKTN